MLKKNILFITCMFFSSSFSLFAMEDEFCKDLCIAIQEKQYETLVNILAQNNHKSINNWYNGVLPLTKAIMYKDLNAVQALLNAGANPDLPNHDNQTPIDYLFSSINTDQEKQIQILKALYNAGANLDMPNILTHFTPLHSAIMDHQEQLVEELLKYGASVKVLADHQLSSLHLVFSRSDNMRIIKLLIDFGTPINVQNEDGDTPLHSAIRANSINGVKALLCHPQIDLCKVNKRNQTGLDIAKSQDYKEIRDTLIQYLGVYTAQGLISKQGIVGAFGLPIELAVYIASFLFRE